MSGENGPILWVEGLGCNAKPTTLGCKQERTLRPVRGQLDTRTVLEPVWSAQAKRKTVLHKKYSYVAFPSNEEYKKTVLKIYKYYRSQIYC